MFHLQHHHHHHKEPEIIQIPIVEIYFELRAVGGRPPSGEAVLEGRGGILSESSPRRALTPLHGNLKMSLGECKGVRGQKSQWRGGR